LLDAQQAALKKFSNVSLSTFSRCIAFAIVVVLVASLVVAAANVAVVVVVAKRIKVLAPILTYIDAN